MTITIDFSPDAIALIREQAAAAGVATEGFIRAASEKAARDAMLDGSGRQPREGKTVHQTMEEPETMEREAFERENPDCCPNDETIAALEEYTDMKSNPDKYKRYGSFREAMDEVLADA